MLPAAQSSGNDAPRRVNGMGTGVVIDPRGYILTNYHVVDGVREIQVTTANEPTKKYVGQVIAHDSDTDLAVVKINPVEKLEPITLGTSSDLMQGETVIAVGNAFGYNFTVTRGIVSALHRAVQINDAQYYDDLIQTDAPINPGNSGGPLLNIDGEMIGVNVAVRAGAQGIGFAIPVDKAVSVAASLLASSGSASWNGIVAAPDVPAVLSGMKLATIEKKSPAADAGLKEGDVVVAVGSVEVHRALDFERELLDRKSGETLTLAVRRDGKPLNVSLALSQRAGRGARDRSRCLGRPGTGVAAHARCPVQAEIPRHALSRRPAGDRRSPEQSRRRTGHSQRRCTGGHAYLGNHYS